MDEKDLQTINSIDMECNCVDDDDSFSVIDDANESESNEDRNLNTKTGIMIDLSDDDDIFTQRVISANIDPKSNQIKIDRNFNNNLGDIHEYNEIDMETEYADDDDEDPTIPIPLHSGSKYLDFGDDEYSETHISGDNFKSTKSYDDYMDDIKFDNKEFVDEEILNEKKKSTTTGSVEANYWKKLQTKHAASNKKGAYNTHFHIAGDPKKEMDMFNHDMTPAPAPSVSAGDVAGNTHVSAGATSGNITGTASGGEGGGEGAACCENLNNTIQKDFEDIFNIIGFEVLQNSDGSLVALDNCGNADDIEADNIFDLIEALTPYIEDCFIYPLQIGLNQPFTTCQEWVDWYNKNHTDEKVQKFAQDIHYCDVLANHLSEY